ncbi:40S ribosomal protein SA-like isoform X2 [Papaver somniferum]|uniref:40S ribosomal protein SA-like isoform X2 n=1 Tax=Papaver somniferum TaxID=3469 RepID=UPI000E6FCCB7|nr:40S ribosomal protein SA-like isoform X2 [Papaver somniferum]XP_026418817.1 40S ribosomal protein SA-like isoform X2 [Papaver somniferum]
MLRIDVEIFKTANQGAALGNIPIIAFCDTDSPMPYVDIGIPANNKGKNSIGCLFWMLARMVPPMRDTILPGHKWDVMVDLFFYRQPEETKDQEVDEGAGPVPDFGVTEYGDSMLANGQATSNGEVMQLLLQPLLLLFLRQEWMHLGSQRRHHPSSCKLGMRGAVMSYIFLPVFSHVLRVLYRTLLSLLG